jgi:DNA-binding beta-propeller fold protein YncE
MVGYDGTALVAVSSGGQMQAVALNVADAQGLAALPDGTVVAATDVGLITIAPSGAKDILAPDLKSVYGVTVGPDGMVYAADLAKVYRIDPATKAVTVFLDPAQFGQVWQPRTIAFDPDSSLMVIGSFGDSVYVVALDENLERVGAPRRLGLVVPDGLWLDALVVDACGNAYVPNYGTASLYRISPDGRSRLYHQWGRDDNGMSQYGHGGDWGVALGGWRTDAIYMPQPYNQYKVVEMVVGVPGAGR